MDPREDDDLSRDDSETDPLIRELRPAMIRLEAQLDQLLAAVRDRSEEAAELRTRLAELEEAIERLRQRFRQRARLWGWSGLFYGIAIGMWLSWLLRQW